MICSIEALPEIPNFAIANTTPIDSIFEAAGTHASPTLRIGLTRYTISMKIIAYRSGRKVTVNFPKEIVTGPITSAAIQHNRIHTKKSGIFS